MPLTKPLPRYRSIPSAVVGGTVFMVVALNCSPCSLSLTHQPSALSHSPAVTEGSDPTTVVSSRCPRAFTRRTQKPLSSLWKVTRSISTGDFLGRGSALWDCGIHAVGDSFSHGSRDGIVPDVIAIHEEPQSQMSREPFPSTGELFCRKTRRIKYAV